ncbi:branched-chain amino acid ABC transporter permease [Jannaschia aquimarina]|uniref:Leucine/isoleucine/valine transporter permease subunit n=1 Tax=Jannaschia aquimarina TaxID=935700 RepID=A0A0D1EIR4_9RHOB|nr:branched-chain amino acid ABC transporter permease [Jannaschia aquimarina]KIT16786.1 leucine/isoleucine/valine transporter permease subunit [Jannaschia aquimarina]SNS52397.1 amino acid/amide ABC transporter membrane protein 2, HAAT family [Jannaschia aquimarina]
MIPERVFNWAVWGGLLAFALLAEALGETYWLTLAARAAIFAIAGVGLNLALGNGGLISFGHAAFFGVGGYAVGILATHAQTYTPLFGLIEGTQSMPVTWSVAIVAGALAALVIGALSLRTSGAYFIMITLAFGQMFYYFAVTWSAYGGEDGMSIYVRGGFPGLNTLDPLHFFGLSFAVLTLVLLLVRMIDRSPFGLALNAVRQSPARVETVGISPRRLRLAAFVVSGAITALAGALFADLNRYVSPAMFSWTISGEIMIFVILGGVARLMGPVVGALVFVALEELLGGLSDYWHIWLGVLLLLIVLFARGGITGALTREARRG